MIDQLWLVINTLETLQIVSTEANLSKMLAAIKTLKQIAHSCEETEKEE